MKRKNVVQRYGSDTIILFLSPFLIFTFPSILELYFVCPTSPTIYIISKSSSKKTTINRRMHGNRLQALSIRGVRILYLAAAGICYVWWVVTCLYDMVLYICWSTYTCIYCIKEVSAWCVNFFNFSFIFAHLGLYYCSRFQIGKEQWGKHLQSVSLIFYRFSKWTM